MSEMARTSDLVSMTGKRLKGNAALGGVTLEPIGELIVDHEAVVATDDGRALLAEVERNLPLTNQPNPRRRPGPVPRDKKGRSFGVYLAPEEEEALRAVALRVGLSANAIARAGIRERVRRLIARQDKRDKDMAERVRRHELREARRSVKEGAR